MMIVKSASDINRDTVNILNAENVYFNSNWSFSGINLITFKDSQTTLLNNLSTHNNVVGPSGQVLKLDYSGRRTSTPSNPKSWIVQEEKGIVSLNTPLSRFTSNNSSNTKEVNGHHNGFEVYKLNIGASSVLNFYTTVPISIVNNNRLFFSIKYKSNTNFAIVQQYTGTVNVTYFPASPDEFSEASVVLLDDISSNPLIISVGLYNVTGEVEVTKPEFGVIGNPDFRGYVSNISTEEEVVLGVNDSNAVTPKGLAFKLDGMIASPSAKGLVNQATASPDSATSVGGTYSQSEVQAILNELRDLKAKMRTAGLLAN